MFGGVIEKIWQTIKRKKERKSESISTRREGDNIALGDLSDYHCNSMNSEKRYW